MKFAFCFHSVQSPQFISDNLQQLLSAPSFLLGLCWDEKKLLFQKMIGYHVAVYSRIPER